MEQITGWVVVDALGGDTYDKKGQGVGRDSRFPPAEGIVVSTDSTAVVTDATGAFVLPVENNDRFVKITTPRGMRARGAWFHDLHGGHPHRDHKGAENAGRGGGGEHGEGASSGTIVDEPEPYNFTLVPDAQRDIEAFTFIQITDLHVDSRGGRVTPPILRTNLATLMGDWAEKVGFVAVTGDLTTHGEIDELTGARQVLDDQPLPFFPLPGNHDLRGEGGTERYLDHFGPDSYSFDWGPVHFIAYNAVDDDPPTLKSWLLADLALVPQGRPVVLLLHFPIGDVLYGALRPYPIVAAICGHWHSSRLYHDGRTAHYSTPPFNFGGGDYTPASYRVFSWKDGQLTARTYALPRGLSTGGELSDGKSGYGRTGGVQSSGGESEGERTDGGEPIDGAPSVHIDPTDPRLGYSFRAMASAPTGPASGRHTPEALRTMTPIEWPQHMGHSNRINHYRHNRHSDNGELAGESFSGLKEAWRLQLPGGLHLAAPVVSSGRLIIGTLDEDRPGGGQVVCLDASTGEPLWTTLVGDSVKNTLASDGERVIGVTVTGEVFALDLQTGTPAWRAALHTPSLRWIFSAPLLADGRVTLGMSGHFACFDAESGDVLWERRDLARNDWLNSFVAPAAADELIIAGFNAQDVGLIGIDALSGDVRWHIGGRRDSSFSTSAVCDDVFYVLRRGGTLQKVAVADGTVLWSTEVSARTPATPLPHNGRLYLATGDGRLQAFSTEDGRLLWERRIGPASHPIGSSDGTERGSERQTERGSGQGAEYRSEQKTEHRSEQAERRSGQGAEHRSEHGAEREFGQGSEHRSERKTERGISKESRNILANVYEDSLTVGTPLLYGDTLWVPGGDGVLYAFDPSDGTELFRYDVGTPLLSAPVPARDGLYVADASGCIHALRWRV